MFIHKLKSLYWDSDVTIIKYSHETIFLTLTTNFKS